MRKPCDAPVVPKAGEGKRGEDGYLGYLLRQAAGAYRLRVERALADLDVTPPQFAVMTMVKAYPGQSSADIARLALLTPQTVSVIIANLERTGSIQRRPHSVHGRILQVELSKMGVALLDQCRQHVHGLENELLEGLSNSDESIVRRWLVQVATNRGG
jgi:DNA-binding MarR family transcriptional regulator